MYKFTIKVGGMQCAMCGAHINDAIRRELRVKKVASSHRKGETVIISENDIGEQEIRDTIEKSGYTAVSIKKEEYEKKGFFSPFRRQS